MNTNGPTGSPPSGPAPLNQDERAEKLSMLLAKERLSKASYGTHSNVSKTSSDPTFVTPLDPSLGDTAQDTLSQQPDTYRLDLPSETPRALARNALIDELSELGKFVKDGKIAIPVKKQENGTSAQNEKYNPSENAGDTIDSALENTRRSVDDYIDTIKMKNGGRTEEDNSGISEHDNDESVVAFFNALSESGEAVEHDTGPGFFDETTRPALFEHRFSKTNPGRLESSSTKGDTVPSHAQNSEPLPFNKATVPSTVIVSKVPTLVDRVVEKPQPKLIIRKPIRGTWFNRIIKSGEVAIQNAKEAAEMFIKTQGRAEVRPVVSSREFEPFNKDTLYADKARINGVSEEVYTSWEGLRKETEEEKKMRLGQEAYDVANRAQANHVRHLGKLSQENKPLISEKPTMRGNVFSRGFKKALKTITTSFTKNGAIEQNENKKIADEMTKRRELQEEDTSYINNHYKKNDHELTDPNVTDTYLKEYDEEDKEDDYTLQVANKKEAEREKKAEEAKKNKSLTTRLKTLFLSKEAKRDELMRKNNYRATGGMDVIEQHPDANVDPETYHLEVKASADAALRKITEKTRLQRESVRRELGPEGKGLLTLLDRGAQFFDNNVSAKTRLFAGVTLAATGALALYATPAIGTIAVMTAAGAGVRVLGASAAYIGIKRTLDKYIKDVDDYNANRDEDDEKRNLKVGRTEKKLFALAGAAGAALLGNLAGEYLAPTLGRVLEEYFPQINDTLFSFARGVTPSVPVTPEVITDITPQVTPNLEAPVVPVAPVSIPEVALPPVIETIAPTISPELLQHTVKPGENLWSILRKTMEASNFEGFNALNDNLKETMIADALSKLPKNPQEYGITSGNINIIASGANIDLTKAFTK